jgi:phosphatidylserine/phosphatidylglycerophosphate/cardiolipin synthase-like enzyme
MIEFLRDREIYQKVILEALPAAEEFIWIATADIKDLHIDLNGRFQPFLAMLAGLVENGVDIRLLHAKEPGPNFRKDFDRYPGLLNGLERNICPRVHLKTIVIDGRMVYLGSANLTGAGIGAKSENRRNFEAGILTDEPAIVEPAMTQFDEIWMGAKCDACQRRDYCADPIA